MSRIYTDENNNYQIDFSKALCSSENLHDIYKDIVNILSDVDWIVETDDKILLIEFKNYEKRKDLPKGDREESVRLQIARKFYGGLFYLLACGMHKPVDFIWIAESPYIDTRMRGHYEESISKWLPYKLQERTEVVISLIKQFYIFSVDDWNREYPQFPLKKTSD